MKNLDGVINIYKEKGYTSHDVVAIVRKMFGKIKTGHTGTLDPMAEGVLPVCIGKATKIADYIMAENKGYRTVINLGVVTDTEDETGTVLSTKEITMDDEWITNLKNTVHSFIGEYYQTPPMYSAIKVNGKKLYELAREGVVLERKQRLVNIHDAQIVDVNDNKVMMDIHCSKGTYIRTLCKDIGEKLGCGASMGSLTRTFSGSFKVEDSIKLSDLKQRIENDETDTIVKPIEEVLSSYKRAVALRSANKFLYNGNKFDIDFLQEAKNIMPDEQFLVFDSENNLAGIFCSVGKASKMQVMPLTMLMSRDNQTKER